MPECADFKYQHWDLWKVGNCKFRSPAGYCNKENTKQFGKKCLIDLSEFETGGFIQ